MPIIPAAIAIGSAVTATVSAVATGVGVAIGAAAGALVSAGTAIVGGLATTVGKVLAIKGVAGAVAGSATSMTIQGVMAKKAQGEVLEAQENEALRFYQEQDQLRAEREYATILEQERAKKQTALDKIASEEAAEREEAFLITSAKGQQIETLANLLSAKESLSASRQVVPIYLSTPQPAQPLSWFDNINSTIHSWFN